MTTKAHWIKRGPIDDETLQKMYAADQDIYPAPLSYQRLESWVKSCPDLSICFLAEAEDGGEAAVPIGVVIALPVIQEHWESLLVGKLKEVDIVPESMLATGQNPVGIGLHVFHIERLEAFNSSARLKQFAAFALEDLKAISAQNQHWNILGYSALTASPQGRAVFKRMGFEPTGYEEMFVASNETGNNIPDIQMVCTYPGDLQPASVGEDQGTVLNTSQMVVRRSNDPFWVEA